MDDSLDSFIDDILKAKGMDQALGDVYKELHADMKTRALDQIDRAILDAMPEDKLNEMNGLLDKNPDASDEDVQQVIQNSGIDVAQITAMTLLRFRGLYLGDATVDEGTVDGRKST
ncbi:hypothetical protein FWF48_03745 [Candidatus Saccharibacteria bacterium]|nr:hypothetical protein [Candidatus Saccharibacteria bacterium]